jgi:Tfp pilus assembly protein PilP
VRRLVAIAIIATLLGLVAGCGEDATTGPTAADYKAERERLLAQMKKNKAAKPPEPEATAPAQATAPQQPESGFGALAESYTYEKKGKRDPFQPFRQSAWVREDAQGPLMAYELEQLSVVAVVWDTDNPRALIADPRGDMHVVKEGSPIGKNDGLVIHIGDNMVLVKETYVDFAGEMTTNDVELRIRSTQGG